MRRLLIAGLLLSLLSAQTKTPATKSDFLQQFAEAAYQRTKATVRYNPKYVKLSYPSGDVPADTGVCTDEVIRAYRTLGIDLQKEVHEDMLANFSVYPNNWNRTKTDVNIDHRRVPNLQAFFRRKGESLPITNIADDYKPGEIVTWKLPIGADHIGMVVDHKDFLRRRNWVVHNIGEGPKMEDVLFAWKITGHYRYYGPNPPTK